jgi:hypothetical protein
MVATPVAENATTVSNKIMSDDVTMWHNRLAHVYRKKISDMIRDKQLPPDAKLDVENVPTSVLGSKPGTRFRVASTRLSKGATLYTLMWLACYLNQCQEPNTL